MPRHSALLGEERRLQPGLEPEQPLLMEHEKEQGITYTLNVPALS